MADMNLAEFRRWTLRAFLAGVGTGLLLAVAAVVVGLAVAR
jgi:hypothetical protein